MTPTDPFVTRAGTAAGQIIEGLERLPPVPEVLSALHDLRDAARTLRRDPASLTRSQRNLLDRAVQRVEELQQLTAPHPAPLQA
ncbi:hypothetical protein [Deinococcus sp. S9]|uniref:hypothetical protein n=1 Tax=Deinococcus sp. S9 TaxID=2545754 RepID=UPI001055FBDE|nr:hypothetical protein [Deinococcus sp. S9]TDE85062.1 hypothetical protein E0686_13955 [Deinococcus sp. S9]